MFKRILVPLDGSELAGRALPVAAQIARASGGSILLFGVVSTPVEYGPPYVFPANGSGWGTEQVDLKKMSEYLQQTASSSILAGVPVETQTMVDAVAPAILTAEQTFQADLVVMSSHGYAGVKRWVLGSVAQKIARHSPVPVLVLRADGAVLTADHPQRVLVPLDGSALAEAAIEPAMQLATAFSGADPSTLHLLRVINLPLSTGKFRAMSAAFERDIQAQEEQAARAYLEALENRLHQTMPAQVQITSSTVVDNDVAAAIIYAGKPGSETSGKSYDALAMATHGRSGFRRWALGSITERVLGATHLPLLIVRPKAVQEQHEPVEAGIKGSDVPWVGLL
jgi:nucleotide-binding universal stress UspA family protein